MIRETMSNRSTFTPALTPPQEMQGLEELYMPRLPSLSAAQERALDPHADPTSSIPPAESSAWSLSLTPSGLSLQTSVRTLAALSGFANKLAHQLCRDFGPEHLPAGWDEDDGMYDDDDDDDELDEAEYLVTVPVFQLLHCFAKATLLFIPSTRFIYCHLIRTSGRHLHMPLPISSSNYTLSSSSTAGFAR